MLQKKNAVIDEQFQLRSWPRYDYNVETRQLVFSEDGRLKVIADIQVAGTTSLNAENWLWGWANSHWPAECVVDSARVRAFGQDHGIGELISEYVDGDDLNGLGWELTAVSARVCDAVGAYRPPDDGGALFLLYRSIWWAS